MRKLTPSLDRRALELDEEDEDTVDLPGLVWLQLDGRADLREHLVTLQLV